LVFVRDPYRLTGPGTPRPTDLAGADNSDDRRRFVPQASGFAAAILLSNMFKGLF
jgi:hypothetical protein